MTIKLFFQAMAKFFFGLLLVGVFIFVPAGTVCFFNGWLLMVLLFVPMFLAGIVLMCKNPGLLKKRLNSKERHSKQRTVVIISALMFLVGFVVAGLTFRFDRYMLPASAVVTASVAFIVGYAMYAEVLRENAYLSRTIEVFEDQHVVDTGLYGVIRHPMYAATVILFLSMPLILGSLYAFAIFLVYPFIIASRIRHEEAFLEKELEGYTDYKKRVRWRLIPFIW